jgi:hypothetical protein
MNPGGQYLQWSSLEDIDRRLGKLERALKADIKLAIKEGSLYMGLFILTPGGVKVRRSLNDKLVNDPALAVAFSEQFGVPLPFSKDFLRYAAAPVVGGKIVVEFMGSSLAVELAEKLAEYARRMSKKQDKAKK